MEKRAGCVRLKNLRDWGQELARNIQALVLGNSAYSQLKLRSPVNDAAKMAESLENVGVKVIVKTDLSYEAMTAVINEFLDKVNQQSTTVSLLYYSGHAMQIEEENYLVPIDFDLHDDGAKFISVQAILDRMTSASAIRIVILDACRTNSSARRIIGEAWSKGVDKGFSVNDLPVHVSSGLAEMSTSSDTFLAFAAAPGKEALDGLPDQALSPFTQALIKNLDVVDLPLSNLTSRVRQDVYKATGGLQRTWDSSSLTNPFYFSPGSILFFMGNFLALSGLIFAVLIFAFVLATPDIKWGWILTAATLPVGSLAALLFAAQTVYSRLRGNVGWDDSGNLRLSSHFAACLRRGLIGGYLGALIAAVPLCVPYYAAWEEPDESLGQLLLEGTLSIAFAACTLGFLCTFFALLRYREVGIRVGTGASIFRTMRGSIIGGIIAGLAIAPIVTLYFGSQ